MKSTLRVRRRPRGFTLVELLVVVAIIGLLLAIFLPTFGMVRERLVRLRCQTNLVNCHKVMAQYAANNRTYFPPFSGSNPMETIDEYGPDLPHQCAEELKSYGARAEIFTCPASPTYDNKGDSKWNSWKKATFTTYSSSRVKQVRTEGYVFFDAFWSGLPQNNYRRWYGHFRDGRYFAQTSDEVGNPPFACDTLRFDSSPYGTSRYYKGWHHKRDNSYDEPGGGGNTIFLSGAVCWYDWEELEAGLYDSPPSQPAFNGASSWTWYYFCGLKPKGG